MAPTVESITKRLVASADVGYDLSNKFYRVLQVLPSAVFEYGCFANQMMYLSANIENIAGVLPTVKLSEDTQVLKDLERLLNFTEEAYSEVKEALPQRQYDGAEVGLLLPIDTPALEDQIEGLQVASTLILAILQLGETTATRSTIVPTSRRFAEAVVNQLKKGIRDLKCSQPREMKRKGTPLKRAKTHTAITEFLENMLVAVDTAEDKATDGEASGSADETAKKGGTKESEKVVELGPEEQDLVKLGHFGADPKEDGMPDYMEHRPENVYAKVHVNDVDVRSLNFYDLPFSKAKENPNFYIIWKPMQTWECENLFQHTKKLRINEAHATIQSKDVIDRLFGKWLGISVAASDSDVPSLGFKELDENLAELKAQDEKRRAFDRPGLIRDRSWSPPPTPRERLPAPRRVVPRYRQERFGATSKTEYWRSWSGQYATLNNALKWAGWQPVYMRGTDAGQTWFYGGDVIHVRRFTEDYTPQDGPIKAEKDTPEVKEYLIIGPEWLEEEALARQGFQFHVLPSGHYSLDSRLTWGDIEAVTTASMTFREERLYRKFRNTAKGDLFEAKTIAVPDLDYINGSPATERPSRSRVPAPAPTNGRHVPHRLENLPEEPAETVFSKKQDVNTPGVESHDSFVEVDN